MKRFDSNGHRGGFCTKPPRSRPAQERAAALANYLSSTESPSYGGFLEFAGLLEDSLTSDIRDAMNAAGLVQDYEQPTATSRSLEEIRELVSRCTSAQAVIKKLQPTARKRTRKT